MVGMFVCSCRAVSDQVICQAIEHGAETVGEITARCGAGGGGGCCLAALERLLEAHASALPA